MSIPPPPRFGEHSGRGGRPNKMVELEDDLLEMSSGHGIPDLPAAMANFDLHKT